MHCTSCSAHNTGTWQHLKIANFRAGKLARKKDGRFQSTEVKTRTENFLDSRKRKSSDSLADAKCHSSSESESETALSGRRFAEFGLLSKKLADGCNYCRSPLQLSNCRIATVSGLGSFLYITSREGNCGDEINVSHLQSSPCK